MIMNRKENTAVEKFPHIAKLVRNVTSGDERRRVLRQSSKGKERYEKWVKLRPKKYIFFFKRNTFLGHLQIRMEITYLHRLESCDSGYIKLKLIRPI